MKKLFACLSFGVLFGLIVALGSAEMIGQTSGVEFCSSCHSMEGAAQSYTLDVHGGNNPYGVKAACADCHLPHDDTYNYVSTKAYNGIKDVYGEFFRAEQFDWVGHLKNRQDFTYSSGCQKCHHLDAIRYEIPKAFLAHRDFARGVVTSCLQCHEHVGHKNIKDFLVTKN